MPRKNGSKSSLLQFTAIWPGFVDLRPGLNKSDTPAPFDQNCSKKRYSWSPEPPVYSPFTSGVCIPARFDHIINKYIEQRDDNDDKRDIEQKEKENTSGEDDIVETRSAVRERKSVTRSPILPGTT